MSTVEVIRGTSPIVLGMPHTGHWLPDTVLEALNETGRALADTDWHIDQLYAGLLPEVTIVRTLVHRYVIDANRDPSGASLYPGQNTTGLCPLIDFDGVPIYREGMEPDAAQIEHRLHDCHAPYHAALAGELARVKALHGGAVLYDCHSIRSRIPFLFDGVLPDLNIGTYGGVSCAPEIAAAVIQVVDLSPYSSVVNGRFKGGWTTRHYGRPAENIHAIQMEIAQSAYLEEELPPWTYAGDKAEHLRETLRSLLGEILTQMQQSFLNMEQTDV